MIPGNRDNGGAQCRCGATGCPDVCDQLRQMPPPQRRIEPHGIHNRHARRRAASFRRRGKPTG